MSDEEEKDTPEVIEPQEPQEEQSFRPLFLNAQNPETWKKPEDKTWGDHFLKPDKPLSARHKQLAKLLALGETNIEIAKKLNYTVSRVSILRSNSKIQAEVDRILDRMHEEDINERIKHLASDALDTMEEILRSVPDPLKREQAARWILEKITGKASQSINVEGEVSLGVFLSKLDQMQGKALAPREVGPALESSEGAPPQDETQEIVDPLEDWLDKNLSD